MIVFSREMTGAIKRRVKILLLKEAHHQMMTIHSIQISKEMLMMKC